MPDPSFNTLVEWLSKPSAYPHQPARVDVVDTHISVLFLADSLVYKLKRPVKYDFLDFTTSAQRRQACLDEVRLNRRLAPHDYLGVVPITCESDGALQLDGNGEAIEWLVQMRRLPVETSLDRVLLRGALRSGDIVRLAQVLADFYRRLTPLFNSPQAYCDRFAAHIHGNWYELLAVSHHCPADIVRRVHGFQLQLLALRPEWFKQRVESGRIVEGHGDLRPEHICLCEPIVIFDCIEFNADFRCLDIADELSFLAAECDFLGANWVGPRLFELMESHIGDCPPPVLIDFYKSYRSCVRAKVSALRADQLTGHEQRQAAETSSRHLHFADAYVSRWARPLVIVVGGLSGTGKSTLATIIADSLGCELLQTDVLRQQLFGKHHRLSAFNRNQYSLEDRERVYAELLREADALQQRGISVVLDGTFSTAAALRAAHQLCSDKRTSFLAIECVCNPAISRQRIARRKAAGDSASEMRPELQQQQSQHWETWPRDECHIQINTQLPLDAQFRHVLAALQASSIDKGWPK